MYTHVIVPNTLIHEKYKIMQAGQRKTRDLWAQPSQNDGMSQMTYYTTPNQHAS